MIEPMHFHRNTKMSWAVKIPGFQISNISEIWGNKCLSKWNKIKKIPEFSKPGTPVCAGAMLVEYLYRTSSNVSGEMAKYCESEVRFRNISFQSTVRPLSLWFSHFLIVFFVQFGSFRNDSRVLVCVIEEKWACNKYVNVLLLFPHFYSTIPRKS